MDIVTAAISVFETSLSKALNNNEIDEREFQVLQDLHFKVVNELSNVDGIRNPKSIQKKSTGRDKRDMQRKP